MDNLRGFLHFCLHASDADHSSTAIAVSRRNQAEPISCAHCLPMPSFRLSIAARELASTTQRLLIVPGSPACLMSSECASPFGLMVTLLTVH